MKSITLNTLVSDIVSEIPKASDLFRAKKIDFCCRGKIPLKDAAVKRGFEPDELLSEVQQLIEKQDSYNDMKPNSLDENELINYIQMKHHRYLRDELPALAPYVKRVTKVHGKRHPELLEIEEIYNQLSEELIAHTDDEDQNVFPLIKEFKKDPSAEMKERLQPHVLELEEEHENAGNLLHKLREVTDNFTPPEDACNTYRLIYQRLNDLEKDTFDHIHLENNVLFEKVRAVL